MRALYRIAKCLSLLALTGSTIVTTVPKSYLKTAALMKSSSEETSLSIITSKNSEMNSAVATESVGWLMAGGSHLF